MKRIAWVLAGIVTLALLAWLAWPPSGAWPWNLRAAHERAGPASPARGATGRRPGDEGRPRLGGDYFSFDAVTRVSQLEGPEARRLLTEGDRLSMLFSAQVACDAIGIDRKFGRADKLPPAQRRSAEFRIAFAEDFCDPALPTTPNTPSGLPNSMCTTTPPSPWA
jgi:hypothetical protein